LTTPAWARFLDARRRGPQVEVVRERFANQRLQYRVWKISNRRTSASVSAGRR
jgi:hypothetical protein